MLGSDNKRCLDARAVAVELTAEQFDGGITLYFRGKRFPEPISIAESKRTALTKYHRESPALP
jgi:hypothetical protein